MSRVKQVVQVRGDSSAASVAVVAVVALGVVGVAAVVALVTVGLVVLGTVATVGLLVGGGARYARYRSDGRAAVRLWRENLLREASGAPTAELEHRLLVQLADPPKPRVALAMRRLREDDRPPAPSTGSARRVAVTWRRP